MKFRKQTLQTPVKQPKGRAFVVTGNGGVFPLAALEETGFQKKDQQLAEEKKWIGADKLAAHPYPVASFYSMWEANVLFWRCVDQIATDVAGLGWTIKLREGMAEDKKQYDKIDALIKKPNPDMSFRRICKAYLTDWGICGNAALQIVRNMKKEIAEVWHMPAGTVWAHEDGQKFCQKRGAKKRWFTRFGATNESDSPLILDPETGLEKNLDLKTRANELIHYHNYYPKSRWYGVPNILPATGDVLIGAGIRDFNLSFFTNYGIPAYLVTLIGDWEDGTGEGETDSIEIIRNFMNTRVKGADKQHTTMVTQAPEGCEIKVEPLSVNVKDGSFRLLKTSIDQEILIAYSMPPYRVGFPAKQGSLAGDVATPMLRSYINGVVEPLQTDLEEIWSDKIFAEGLDCPSYEIVFANIDIKDAVAEAELIDKQIRTGQMTPNQARKLNGLKPYPGGDSYYMEMNLVTVGEDPDGDTE